MRVFTSLTDPQLITCLNEGGVVVIPTDTVYGIVARTANQRSVERVYRLRGRAPDNPCIILVADMWQIWDKEYINDDFKKLVKKYWPGPLSLISKVSDKTPHYLHRGTATLAYRMPHYAELRKLLAATGPLIAPSANLTAQPTATTLAEAQAYFGEDVDGYVDGGVLLNRAPSTVATVAANDGTVRIVRQGALRIV